MFEDSMELLRNGHANDVESESEEELFSSSTIGSSVLKMNVSSNNR